MTILFLHNKYLISGGEDVSTESEISLLRLNGHDVDVVYLDNKDLNEKSNIAQAINTIWSNRSYNLVKRKLTQKPYDLVHVQNFFPQFSPSIFYAIKSLGIKVVMSIRNYRLMCPNALLYINNKNCELCLGKKIPYPALKQKCYKQSLGATAVTVTMLSLHNFLNTWNRKIDGFIAISEFVKNQLIVSGITDSKIYVKPNFVINEPVFKEDPDNHYLYIGRLSVEKGIDNMLSVFMRNPSLKLKIIGEGPLLNLISEAANQCSNIIYLGKLSIHDTYKQLGLAKALIFPSKWHEPFGRTIVEAFAAGTPVIGSRVGAVTELIIEGYNGFLYDTLDDLSLEKTLNAFEALDKNELRKNARSHFDTHFTAGTNYKALISIYEKIISR